MNKSCSAKSAASAWQSASPAETPTRRRHPPGPFQAHASGPSDSAVYRWSADGRWEQVAGPCDSHVYALATADGSLFAGLGDGTLLRSDDRGESWHDLGERVERVTALVAN